MKESSTKKFFHYLSYLQYPIMVVGLWFIIRPLILKDQGSFLENYNMALIMIGLGISISTLQDTAKTQNKASRKIWEDPGKGKFMIILFSVAILVMIGSGLFFYLATTQSVLQEVSIGIMVVGIGSISMLKAMIEMRENHRKDRSTPEDSGH